MSAPTVVQVTPNDKETDIVLGQAIVIVFDQVIDASTLNDDTFSLNYQAPTQILTAGQLISGDAVPSTVSVPGTWSCVIDSHNRTVATFTSAKAFQQNTSYTATLFGSDAELSSQNVMNSARESMAGSYQWGFVSGILNLTIPPIVSPLVDSNPPINPMEIRVIPRLRHPVGQDLSQQFDILFPDEIDPTSFLIDDLMLSIEPLLGFSDITLPANLQYKAVVNGNRISIVVTGWTN